MRLELQRLEDRTMPSILGTADSFAILAGSTVTNTGPTVILGDLGVSPGLAITGFPPGLVSNGTSHASDAVALQAENDLVTAYNVIAGEASTTNLTGQDLGGLTLTAGVYRFSTSAQLTGILTLDAQGDPDARFDFQIGSTLTTASNSLVRLINNADGCNVYWQVGSSATLGTATEFEGNILALTSITLNTGATIPDGRALARNGAVTLDTNSVTALCADISGRKFNDVNGDGILQSGEPGLAGVTVFLDTNGNGALDLAERFAITDANGNYEFANLGPGTYRVREVQQAGLQQTTPILPDITLTSGQEVTDINIGDRVLPLPPLGAAISLLPTFPLTEVPLTNFALSSKVLLLGSTITANANGMLLAQANFVSALYQNVLGRVSDSAGLMGWVQMLQNGFTRAQVADGFWRSAEHRGLEIDQFYLEFLHRSPGTTERTIWVNAFLRGASELDVMRAILSSAEYSANHVSDTAFVNGLYGDVLGRAADAPSQAVWLQTLANGASRETVAQLFLMSAEASRRVVDDFYVNFLGRVADQVGEQTWVALLQNGQATFESVAVAILSSDEYQTRASGV